MVHQPQRRNPASSAARATSASAVAVEATPKPERETCSPNSSWSGASAWRVARFARVYPLYAAVVIFSYVMFTFVDRQFEYRIFGTQMVLHLLLVGDKYVFWTIPPEIQFYLVFARIWLLRHRRPDFVAPLPVDRDRCPRPALDPAIYPGPKFAVTSYAHFFLAGVFAGHGP